MENGLLMGAEISQIQKNPKYTAVKVNDNDIWNHEVKYTIFRQLNR